MIDWRLKEIYLPLRKQNRLFFPCCETDKPRKSEPSIASFLKALLKVHGTNILRTARIGMSMCGICAME